MKSQIAVAAAALALAFGATSLHAAGASWGKVTGNAMAEKGRYHRIHEKQEKLDCEDCHEKRGLPDNTLFIRLHEPVAKKSPGPVVAEACHECHGKKQKAAVTWYAPKSPKK